MKITTLHSIDVADIVGAVLVAARMRIGFGTANETARSGAEAS